MNSVETEVIAPELLSLRILSVVVLLGLLYFVNRRIQRAEISFTLGMLWNFALGLACVLTLFPQVLVWCAHTVGVQVPANFLFFAAQAFLLLLVFGLTLKSARQERQIVRLVQELALMKLELHQQTQETKTGSGFDSQLRRIVNQ